MESNPPTWNPEDNTSSLRQYAAWLNDQARASLLRDGTHADLWFLLQENGEGQLIPTPPDMDKDDLAAALKETIEQAQVYGVIHIAEVWGYFPRDANDHTAKQIMDGEIPVSGLKDSDKTEALMVQMESRDGDGYLWISPIVRENGGTTLAEASEVSGLTQGRFTGLFSHESRLP